MCVELVAVLCELAGSKSVSVEVCSEHFSHQEEHRVADWQTVHREDSRCEWRVQLHCVVVYVVFCLVLLAVKSFILCSSSLPTTTSLPQPPPSAAAAAMNVLCCDKLWRLYVLWWSVMLACWDVVMSSVSQLYHSCQINVSVRNCWHPSTRRAKLVFSWITQLV